MTRIADSFRCYLRELCEALASIALRAARRVCARILDAGACVPFCRACTEDFTRTLPEPLCAQFGRPVILSAVASGMSLSRCRLGQAQAFDLTRSFGAYDRQMSCAILLLQYGILAPSGAWFTPRLASPAQVELQIFVADAVLPGPLAEAAGAWL